MWPLKIKHQATIGLSVFSARYLVTDRAVTQCDDVTHPCLVTTDNVCPLCPLPRCPLCPPAVTVSKCWSLAPPTLLFTLYGISACVGFQVFSVHSVQCSDCCGVSADVLLSAVCPASQASLRLSKH